MTVNQTMYGFFATQVENMKQTLDVIDPPRSVEMEMQAFELKYALERALKTVEQRIKDSL